MENTEYNNVRMYNDNVMTDTVDCPICGAMADVCSRQVGRRVGKCANCGSVFACDVPDGVCIPAYFGEKGLEDAVSEKTRIYQAANRRLLELVNSEAGNNRGKLLDVGCGLGIFLAMAQADGWEAEGWEISDECIEYCRNKGLKAVYTRFPKSDMEKGVYDVVILSMVLSSLVETKKALREACGLLKKGGVLAIRENNPRFIKFLMESGEGISWIFKVLTGERRVTVNIMHISEKEIKETIENYGMTKVKTFPSPIGRKIWNTGKAFNSTLNTETGKDFIEKMADRVIYWNYKRDGIIVSPSYYLIAKKEG